MAGKKKHAYRSQYRHFNDAPFGKFRFTAEAKANYRNNRGNAFLNALNALKRVRESKSKAQEA